MTDKKVVLDQNRLAQAVTQDVARALAEDVGSGDLTAGLVPANKVITARILARESAMICGRPWVEEVIRAVDSHVSWQWHVREGMRLRTGGIA